MATDILETFLAAPTATRLRMAQANSNAEALRAYLGSAGYDEYRQLAGRLDLEHLGVQVPPNLIFVPGVMGSLLQSRTHGGIWWIDVRTRHHIDDLRLGPNGQQDADPNNQIIPTTTDPSYEQFLAAVLQRDDFGHELFPYDWRKPLGLSTAALKNLILKLHAENGNRSVHLVAHSMGGLMVRAALMAHGDELWPALGRVVFIATPHFGSPAIAGYLKNHLWGFDLMAVMGAYLSRETFRSLRGVLSMLLAPRGVYPGTREQDAEPWVSANPDDPYVHPCGNFDFYRAESWKLDLSAAETNNLQECLDEAADTHRRLYAWHLGLDQRLRDRMLVIAGVGYKTLFRLEEKSGFLGLWDHMDKITGRVRNDPHREGDARVPLASAALDFVPIRYVKGVHGGLANIPLVYEEAFRWLKEEPLALPDNISEALSEHLDAAGEESSQTPHLDGSARSIPFTDDPGIWDLAPPDPIRMSTMKEKLEAEQLPEFTRLRLL